jgi:hypothetical protein
VGQYDKLREAGSALTDIGAKIGSYFANNHAKDQNPWNNAAPAYSTDVTTTAGTSPTASAFAATMDGGASVGQVKLYLQTPGGTASTPGFAGAAVKVQNAINGSTVYRKITAIE